MAPLTLPVGEAKPGETAPRRKAAYKDAPLVRPQDSKATNIPEFIEECVERNPSNKAMGWRNLIDTHVEVKQVTKFIDGKETKVDKEWIYYELSPYNYITYRELLTLVQDYSKGLIELGLKPNQEAKVFVYASTSPKWMQTFLASAYQNVPIVTAYDTLGESGLTHSLVQTESDLIFTDNNLLQSLVNPLQKAKNVKYIIHSEQIDPNDKRSKGKIYEEAKLGREKILEVRPDIKFISYDDVIALGKKSSLPLHYPKPEDLACIMYTSGSTGDPKGVVLTHENLVAGVGGISSVADRDLVTPKDRVIAFLPLAHIFELAFEIVNFWWGSTLGYANVKTLTDVSCRNCQSDLLEFKPTIMVGVAAVWESVRKGVLAKVKQLPFITQKIFWTAFKAKSTFTHYGLPGADFFDIIFKKVKAATGGELRWILNGGSPISKDAQIFISTLIAPMLLGYGLTETTANTTVVDHHNFEYDCLGTILGSTTCKLVDVPDAGYFAKNNQGEILLKGKSITSEYYKNEKETAAAFTEDGWFRTGDIGEWTHNGGLRIIDRKKNLVKTLNGEYIALEKLESIYRSNPTVLNLCVYADQSKVKPIAIILPNEQHLKQHLVDEKIFSKEEVERLDIGHLVHDQRVIKSVHKYLLQTGKSQGLRGIELIQTVVLLDDEWTPQNGLVTSAQKLQRKKILASCKDQVDAAYAKS
ncbi:long-chain fatty acid--CoA ligase and synthetase 4 [Scheffersomyces amazonensis]|uniref:long-chain fatty acid--CoA ligase and synthetase 4 n=1 Tax=Scheffersomyces amazonensis TaxID=1078765 RepID=UPI00315CD6D1